MVMNTSLQVGVHEIVGVVPLPTPIVTPLEQIALGSTLVVASLPPHDDTIARIANSDTTCKARFISLSLRAGSFPLAVRVSLLLADVQVDGVRVAGACVEHAAYHGVALSRQAGHGMLDRQGDVRIR